MSNSQNPKHLFCVAPMMDWTDRHCRAFHRVLTKHALLYTEMITAAAIRFGKRDKLLAFSDFERPVALQLGGSDPAELALAARLGEEFGYVEINLNCGCPSERVQEGRFGACLMAEPNHVGDCVAAMRDAVKIPVTVKCRIGVDDQPESEPLDYFVDAVARAGCRTFVVHARKAWLKGLSPRANRDVPPLNYERVYRLKRDHPSLEIVINGGIRSLAEAEDHLRHVDGVMLGRAAYEQPYLLIDVDRRFFGNKDVPPRSREDVIAEYLPYIQREIAAGARLAEISRHMLGLYHGQYGGSRFRRALSENMHRPDAAASLLERALSTTVPPRQLIAAE
jgi:tRNA-dihydrouridine synthase A